MAVVRQSPNFTPPQTPFPGAHDHQNLISWRWSLPAPIDPVWWRSMHAIFRVIVMTDTARPPATNTQTHRQDQLQYTAPQLASAQCNINNKQTQAGFQKGRRPSCWTPLAMLNITSNIQKIVLNTLLEHVNEYTFMYQCHYFLLSLHSSSTVQCTTSAHVKNWNCTPLKHMTTITYYRSVWRSEHLPQSMQWMYIIL